MKERHVFIIFLGILLIIIGVIFILQEADMQYYNYTDLEITSSKKPYNTHLWWEHSTYGLVLVDSGDQTKLYISTDEADNWSNIDLSGATTKKIQAGWLDTNDLWLVCCDNSDDEFTVIYVELDNSNNVVDVGDSTGADAGTVYGFDIFKIGTDHFVINKEERLGVIKLVVWDVDATPFTEKDTWEEDEFFTGVNFWFGIISGTKYYSFLEYTAGSGPILYVKYDNSVPSITIPVVAGVADYIAPSSKNQYGVSFDGNTLLYFIGQKIADSKNYLITYDTTDDSHTVKAEYNICLMIDRNTASGVMEKAFHLTEYKVYQLHPTIPYQLHFISKVDSDAALIAITDNYLMNDDGDMFEYEDCSKYVIECSITRKDMKVPEASMDLMNIIPLEKGMFIVVKDTFTTATATSTATIFEGYVDSFSDRLQQVAVLISPAIELRNIRPSGEYSGRSDQIISSLISDYCKYITAGTLSEGGAMGDIDFYGDKTMEDILDDLALFDNFTWYLTPTGALYYNDGTVDTGEDFTSTSRIFNLHKQSIMRAINYVKIKGAYVSGTQVVSDAYESEKDQQINGINPFERTHSHLDTAALCNTTASNILTRFGTQPEVVEFDHHDGSVGLMQEAQTITVTYTGPDISISETQYGIREVVYDAVRGRGHYRVSDRLI